MAMKIKEGKNAILYHNGKSFILPDNTWIKPERLVNDSMEELFTHSGGSLQEIIMYTILKLEAHQRAPSIYHIYTHGGCSQWSLFEKRLIEEFAKYSVKAKEIGKMGFSETNDKEFSSWKGLYALSNLKSYEKCLITYKVR